MNMSDKPAMPPRRLFLRKGISAMALVVGSAALYPVMRFLGFNIPAEPKKIKINKLLPDGGFAINHDFILFSGQEKQWAVSRKCTHLGCRLNLNENEKLIICPCHQSKFDYSGMRLAGPATKNLTRYKVEKLTDGYLVIM